MSSICRLHVMKRKQYDTVSVKVTKTLHLLSGLRIDEIAGICYIEIIRMKTGETTMGKKLFALLLTATLCVGCFAGCGETGPAPVETLDDLYWLPEFDGTDATEDGMERGKLVILYTNDVHNAYAQDLNLGTLGYASLTAYRDALEEKGNTVVLIDGGDALQGGTIGTLSKGAYMVDIMNEAGYAFAVPGEDDFAFGVENFLELAENVAKFIYISCNFVDAESGVSVLKPYVIEDYNGLKVAYLGISLPETVLDDEKYGFVGAGDCQALYDCVQQSIDDATSDGADIVIAVGHLGTANKDGFSAIDVIRNTTGLTAFLDGHSHTQGAGVGIRDRDDKEVAYCANAGELTSFGEILLKPDSGEVENTVLVTDFFDQDLNMVDFLNNISSQHEALLEKTAAWSGAALILNDPETEERLIRKQETNLGDFCADAYRTVLGADVGLVNGGEIAAGLPEGGVTYGDIFRVLPYGSEACLVEATGQQILDALELAYRAAGEAEYASFLHISGLTCEIDTSIPSSVELDEDDRFLSAEGERRVKNVKIGGVEIDPDHVYTVASHGDLLKLSIGGFSMFSGCRILKDEVMPDHQVMTDYIREVLGGVISADTYGNPDGDGRITIQ